MNKRKVVITGAAGNIGRIIVDELSELFDFTLIDTNDLGFMSRGKLQRVIRIDVATEREVLRKACQGAYAIIHLAWNTKEENWKSLEDFPPNKVMAKEVLMAAVALKIRRLVVASSIHAADFTRPSLIGKLLEPNVLLPPKNPYGASKLYVEFLSWYYATKHHLQVICPRFGGVHPDDRVRDEPRYRQIMLSCKDCASLICRCLEVRRPPSSFSVLYAISDNKDAFLDWSNKLGWVPQDDCTRLETPKW